MAGFWDMKSDAQQDPENSRDPLDEALEGMGQSSIHIYRLMEARFGSYIEIAYEWTWDEAMTYLEMLDMREEIHKREEMKRQALERVND